MEGETEKINLKNSANPFTILYNHAPLIGSIENGVVEIYNNEKISETINYKNGFVRHINNECNISILE
jgi:F0F1-type ATP synthase epsilon subunit